MLGEKQPEGMEVVQGAESAKVQAYYEVGVFSKRELDETNGKRVNEMIFGIRSIADRKSTLWLVCRTL